MFNLLFLVSYGEINDTTWKFDHSKLENHQSFLKSNDIINLNLKKMYDNNHKLKLCQLIFCLFVVKEIDNFQSLKSEH